jgi:YkoY family integral membrane protein
MLLTILGILLTITILFLIEGLLSVDNAAVLAVMVKPLPEDQRSKALRYGIIGACVLRGAALFFATLLIKIYWLKICGGLYLLYLVYGFFSPKNDTIEEPVKTVNDSKIYKFIKTKIGISQLWSTIILVEIMDMAFSIDNIFASVAVTQNFTLIIIGVVLGILAMRFIAMKFVKLLEQYPILEKTAYIVIALLGLKLILAGVLDYCPDSAIKTIVESEVFDMGFSVAMVILFAVTIFISKSKNKNIQKLVV